MILTGYKRPLVEQDMYNLEKANATKNILSQFDKELDRIRTKEIIKQIQSRSSSDEYELPMADKVQVKINIVTLVMRLYWKQLMGAAILKFVSSCLTLVNPLVLDYVITFMSNMDEPLWHGILYASLMLFTPMLESILNGQHEYWVNVIVLRIRVCLTSIVYKKVRFQAVRCCC